MPFGDWESVDENVFFEYSSSFFLRNACCCLYGSCFALGSESLSLVFLFLFCYMH